MVKEEEEHLTLYLDDENDGSAAANRASLHPRRVSENQDRRQPTRLTRAKVLNAFVLILIGGLLGYAIGGHGSDNNGNMSAPDASTSASSSFGALHKFKTWLPFDSYGKVISPEDNERLKVYQHEMPLKCNISTDMVSLNSTLGFQEIFALHLPHRVDKADELALMGYTTGLNITLFEGVNARDLKNMRIADHPKNLLKDGGGAVAALRAHTNLMRHIVKHGIQTSLVFEDDVDWSVDIKRQMQILQEPLARLVGSMKKDNKRRGPTTARPYGLSDDWDVLYMGACGEYPWGLSGDDKTEVRTLVDDQLFDWAHLPYATYPDPTVLDRSNLTESPLFMFDTYKVPLPQHDTPAMKRRRIVQRSRGPICTAAYAVSLRGAARILYHMSRPFLGAFDNELGFMLDEGEVAGLTVFPPLFKSWTPKGGHNSDIHAAEEGEVDKYGRYDLGHTEDVSNSTRLHLYKDVMPSLTRHGKLVEKPGRKRR